MISYEISKYGNDVTTVDVQDKSLKKTINKYQIKLKDFNFLLAGGHKLPFKPNSFDVVICNQVIEHVPKQHRHQLINEAHSALKSNGIFYIATPNKLWPIEPHVRLPFLSYLPINIANRYANVFRKNDKYDNYDVVLLYLWELKRILCDFYTVVDLTPVTIKNTETFYIKDEIPEILKPLLKRFPLSILQLFSSFFPSWILIGVK